MTYLFQDLPPSSLPSSDHLPTPLRFSPAAWAKLLFWRDLGSSQVGAWGLSDVNDLLLVEDVRLVRQTSSLVAVVLDDSAEDGDGGLQYGAELTSERTNRIWIQLHADASSQPTAQNEQTFQRALGRAAWGVLCILGRQEEPYARLQFFVGPGGSCLLPVGLQFGEPFAGSDYAAWDRDYQAQVIIQSCFRQPACPAESSGQPAAARDWQAEWEAHVRSTPQASLELEGLAPQQSSCRATEACDTAW